MPAKPGPLRSHEERLAYARTRPKEPPPGQPALGDSFLVVTVVSGLNGEGRPGEGFVPHPDTSPIYG